MSLLHLLTCADHSEETVLWLNLLADSAVGLLHIFHQSFFKTSSKLSLHATIFADNDEDLDLTECKLLNGHLNTSPNTCWRMSQSSIIFGMMLGCDQTGAGYERNVWRSESC